ncbi:hypothetical protein LZ30DRAFT_16190, partial [Colletotrichum cereale]
PPPPPVSCLSQETQHHDIPKSVIIITRPPPGANAVQIRDAVLDPPPISPPSIRFLLRLVPSIRNGGKRERESQATTVDRAGRESTCPTRRPSSCSSCSSSASPCPFVHAVRHYIDAPFLSLSLCPRWACLLRDFHRQGPALHVANHTSSCGRPPAPHQPHAVGIPTTTAVRLSGSCRRIILEIPPPPSLTPFATPIPSPPHYMGINLAQPKGSDGAQHRGGITGKAVERRNKLRHMAAIFRRSCPAHEPGQDIIRSSNRIDFCLSWPWPEVVWTAFASSPPSLPLEAKSYLHTSQRSPDPMSRYIGPCHCGLKPSRPHLNPDPSPLVVGSASLPPYQIAGSYRT